MIINSAYKSKKALLPTNPEESHKTSHFFKGDRYRQKYELIGKGGNTRSNTIIIYAQI